VYFSLLANTFRAVYGDIMFVYAVADLADGDELTTNYTPPPPTEFFVERKNTLRKKWEFRCECCLCILNRSEPGTEMRRQELMMKLEKIEFSTTFISCVYILHAFLLGHT
jgi:hypothetical protein